MKETGTIMKPIKPAEVISFQATAEERKQFVFRAKNVNISTHNGVLQFPCIGLYHVETGLCIGYPGYERWLFEMQKAEEQASKTLHKKAVHLCSFLNYILWNTNCDRIQDITLTQLRDFLQSYREVGDRARDPMEWTRGVGTVVLFLNSYITHNMESSSFKISPTDLISPYEIKTIDGNRKIIVAEKNHLYVKLPKKGRKKYRMLLHGHLDLLLFEAKKYDPMILPGIMLQAYAGLREGEVVNLTFGKINRTYMGFGRIGKVILDLSEKAGFAIKGSRKTDFGSIKIYREQEVYTDFLEKVLKELDKHELYLEMIGCPTESGSPLLYNKRRKPMSVQSYSDRVKALFYEHFLPDLKRLCEAQNDWAANAPYIEIYEQEYPGAHMFRHWFTMYLIQYTPLKIEEISKWRGDGNPTSMKDYIHVNARFIAEYNLSVFTFQRHILEEIL